jgi:hypothetical protein
VKGDVSFTGEIETFICCSRCPGPQWQVFGKACTKAWPVTSPPETQPAGLSIACIAATPWPLDDALQPLWQRVCNRPSNACMHAGVNTFHMPALTLMNNRMDHPCSTGLFATVERGIHCLCNETPHR